MNDETQSIPSQTLLPLYQDISEIIRQARGHVQQAVNQVMVQSYWQIGRLIVEHEQQGNSRAAYGKQQLQTLSSQLTTEFGKGFDISNLRRMRSFYQAFPIQGTLCPELSWSHYRKLIAIEKESARQWYMQETVEQNWSVRALDRQINKLYYERLLSSDDSTPLKLETGQKIAAMEEAQQLRPKDVLRDPMQSEKRSGGEIFGTHRQQKTLCRQVSALSPNRSRTQTRT